MADNDVPDEQAQEEATEQQEPSSPGQEDAPAEDRPIGVGKGTVVGAGGGRAEAVFERIREQSEDLLDGPRDPGQPHASTARLAMTPAR